MNSHETKWGNDEIIEHLSQREVVKKFLQQQGIVAIKSASSIDRYEVSGDRKGFIVKVQETGNDNLIGVMVDVKHGQPSTDQVFDAVYGSGTECKLRVLLFDGNTSEREYWNPAADEIVVESFVNAMNSYGANICLVKMNMNPGGCIKCETVTAPDEIIEPSIAEIPPEDVVRENEFWELFYWSQLESFFVAHKCLTEGLNEHCQFGHQMEMDALCLRVRWDETGVFYEIRNESPEEDFVKILWESTKYELQGLFRDYRVTFSAKPGITSRIIINASDLPVRSLVDATVPFKEELAERILSEFMNLGEFLEGAIDDYKNGTLKGMDEFKSLAEVC